MGIRRPDGPREPAELIIESYAHGRVRAHCITPYKDSYRRVQTRVLGSVYSSRRVAIRPRRGVVKRVLEQRLGLEGAL